VYEGFQDYKYGPEAFDTRFITLLSKFKNLHTLILNDENKRGIAHIRFTQKVWYDTVNDDGVYSEEEREVKPFSLGTLKTLKLRFNSMHHYNDLLTGPDRVRYDLNCYPNLQHLEICQFDDKYRKVWDENTGGWYMGNTIRRLYNISKELDTFVLKYEFSERPKDGPHFRHILSSPFYTNGFGATTKVRNTIHILPTYPQNYDKSLLEMESDWFDGKLMYMFDLRTLEMECSTLHIQNAVIRDKDFVHGENPVNFMPKCETMICQDCLFSGLTLPFMMRTVKHFVVLDKYDQKTLHQRSGMKESELNTYNHHAFTRIHPDSRIESITYYEGVISDQEINTLVDLVRDQTGRTLVVDKRPNPLNELHEQKKVLSEQNIQTQIETSHATTTTAKMREEMEQVLDQVDLFEVASELTTAIPDKK
jgi:hypothetical protein